MGLFDKFKTALKKSRDALLGGLRGIVGGRKLDEDLLEEIEEALIESDVGVRTTEDLLDDLRRRWKDKEITEGDQVIPFFKQRLAEKLGAETAALNRAPGGPTVILVDAAAQALIGTPVDDAALAALAAACSAAASPIDDKRGTTEYRKHMAGVLARRATTLAKTRAGGAA